MLTAAVGVFLGALFSWVPALHVYTVAGCVMLVATSQGGVVSPEGLSMLFLGMVTAYAMLNGIPSIFLSAPDDSTVFMVRPGQKYLLQGRAYEASLLSGVGGLGGVTVLALLVPVAPRLLSDVRAILGPHLHWTLWAVIAYVLLSEWPKGSGRQPAGWRRMWDGWRNLTAGLVTSVLSGLLGFVLLYRSVIPVQVAYQNLLPAFTGLFAVPWVLQNLLSRVELPEQHLARTLDVTVWIVFGATLAGALGGLFAAFFPVVTGGIGGLLAGHATAQRDDRVFLISQGASKVIYYVGAFLLFFVPRLHLTRGGVAWMLSTRWTARAPATYYAAVAVVVFSGLLSFLLLPSMARLAARLTGAVSYRWISLVTLAVLFVVVLGVTGWGGFLVCVVATGIGLIPVLWGARRVNAMGVLLLPLALNMTGLGSSLARWLGLLG